ncbi:MAG: hypothetical protein AB7E81_15575 [Hyphomicrobiaceae bacterium]
MAFDTTSPIGVRDTDRPLHAALSTAFAGVSGVCERLGLREKGLFSAGGDDADIDEPREDPNHETWASANEAIANSAEVAAFAAGLHHQAAAELDDIEHELVAIAALINHRTV